MLLVSAGLLVLVELFNRLGPVFAARRAEADDSRIHDLELQNLRHQIKDLKARAHDHNTYFLNLSEAVRNLVGATGVREVSDGCYKAVSSMLMTGEVAILLVDDGGALRLVDGDGFPAKQRHHFVLGAGESERILSQFLEAGVVCVVDHSPSAKSLLAPLGGHWDLAAPLWQGGHLLGLVLVARPSGDDALVHRVLAMLAELTSAALVSARDVDSIQRQADGLTRMPLRPIRAGVNGVAKAPVLYAASWAPAPMASWTPDPAQSWSPFDSIPPASSPMH